MTKSLFHSDFEQGSADIETSKTSTVDKPVQDVPKKNKDKDGNDGTVHSVQTYPWHFHADIVNGNIAKCPQNHPSGMVSQDFMFHPMRDEIHGHGNFQATTASATTTTSHQAFPACHSQDDYRSFLQMSSTFSNLIMSTLLQNPAAHAAATFAASVWPYANVGNSGDPSTPVSSSPPSIAAIAAATVAAATAWWASHGLLPLCAPAPVTCVPLPTVAVPTPVMTEMDTVENAQLPLEKQNTALQDQSLASKSPDSSSDDSEETGVTKLNADSKTNGDKIEDVIVTAAVHDSNVTKKNSLVDRSSCGSNTPSGSDAETYALDKMEKDNEDVKETDENRPDVNELNNRKNKMRDNYNPATDSWKEVSEEVKLKPMIDGYCRVFLGTNTMHSQKYFQGRIAFQALFARERLPQSFSPPQVAENVNGKQSNTSMPLAPNFKVQDSCDADQERVVMIGVGPGKSLKTRQTGFKPYKRCSMELKESQVGNTNNQSDEKACKRLRLEGEASI